MATKLDALVVNHGSLSLVHLHTAEARQWVEDNVLEGAQFFAGNLVVEHRYIDDLVDGMALDGLRVR